MGYLRKYLRDRRRGIGLFALFAAIFAVSFRLYHLPLAAAAYPMLLCLALGAISLALDFVRQRRRYSELQRLTELPAAEITGLPEPATSAEEALCNIIMSLRSQLITAGEDSDRRYRDTVEYYTLWVHQIKTPITSMSLTLEKEDTALTRRLRSELSQVQRYVGMVLAFLRLDSEATDYVFREQDLTGIVDGVLARFAPEFIDRRLRLDYRPLPMSVVTDEKWLEFVLEQIISNALKYTREGGTVTVRFQEPRTVYVEDTGIGIAASDLPRVFERGYTGFNGRRDTRASGIGLYLVKRVCDRLGIGIEMTSQPGRGTAVRLDLTQYRLRRE